MGSTWNNRFCLILQLIIGLETSDISYNLPKLPPNATWDQNFVVIANSSKIGDKIWALFIDRKNDIYVSAKEKHSIQIWYNGSLNSTETIPRHGISHKNVFVTADGDIYTGRDDSLGSHVEKWTKNTSNWSTNLLSESCYNVFIDINDSIYCSLGDSNQVIKQSIINGSSKRTTVAGNGIAGNAPNQLYMARGIFVTTNFSLYVADCGNHRLQLFQPDQEAATTIIKSDDKFTLGCLNSVILDQDGYVFITDFSNRQIIGQDSNGFRCVAGCDDPVNPPHLPLQNPAGLSFDSHGNLFVIDENSHRLLKFLLIDNSDRNSECSRTPSPCDISGLCQNNGFCHESNTTRLGFICRCPSNFSGKSCEIDHRPCQPNTCWNNGICYEPPDKRYSCRCQVGWEGDHCERKIDLCREVTCLNRGVCRSMFRSYTCECLGDSYSGRHCEIVLTKTKIYKTVSKSFGYIGIISLIIVGSFVVVMDILKYCFGIDPVRDERAQLRRQYWLKKLRRRPHHPVIQRFIYVNASSTTTET